jgi:hypothetical protein
MEDGGSPGAFAGGFVDCVYVGDNWQVPVSYSPAF